MNIVLIPDGFLNWQGGRDLFCRFYTSLNAALRSDDQLFIWSNPASDSLPWRVRRVLKHLLSQFPPDARWIAGELRRPSRSGELRDLLGGSVRYLKTLDHRICRKAAGECAVTVGSMHAPPPPFQGVPSVRYIYDCQHRRMPQFFSDREISERDRWFSETLASADVVVVTSRSVKNDLLQFFSPFRSEIVSLPFSAAPDESWLLATDYKVLATYSVNRPFFLCSNQLWKHKNHQVILEAIALSMKERKPLNFVFTGPMGEYRDPAYVPSLPARVEELGVTQYCRFLGLIPKIDQIQLMRLAVAVVQPTLFEGAPGGGAISDAISLGRPTVVSDIPVNREIEEHVTAFFDPCSPEQLLDVLVRLDTAAPSWFDADALRHAGAARREKYGEVLLGAFTRSTDIARART